MGRLIPQRARRATVFALTIATVAVFGASAWATGPGGWGHLGDAGPAGTDSLNGAVYALRESSDVLYVGGAFVDAGGAPSADRIATWNRGVWAAVGSPTSQISNGAVFAIASAGGKVYAGGTFQDAGGNANADFLAVWNGVAWAPFCTATGPAFGGNVLALEVVGSTLYVGGAFQNGAGIATGDYLLACDLNTGAARATTVHPAHPFSGPIYALTATSDGRLYAGGRFGDLENIPAADNIAYLDAGGWHAMGGGGGPCSCAIDGFVRSLAASGSDVYVGTDVKDVAGVAQADNVVKWDGATWRALGSDTGGANGWFPASTYVYALATFDSRVFATGSFQNANGDPRADNVAFYDGSAWHGVGSDGAGNGPWIGNGLALAVLDRDRQLYAGGSFTSAGGDGQAQFGASFHLAQIIGFPVPQPDLTPPMTTLTSGKVDQARHRATFRFSSNEANSTFLCKLDSKPFASCVSPKTYRNLKRGKHEFRVKARDNHNNLDATPALRKFAITR